MRLRSRVLVALTSSVVLLGGSTGGAQAATVPQVSGVTANGVNLSTQKLAVRWTAVSSATYQSRWASSTSGLAAAHVYGSSYTSALSPVLSSVCSTWYAQVRAVRGGVYGSWSAPRALAFNAPSYVPAATPVTSGQTSTTAAQVRWSRVPGAAGYRAHWSPAPYGHWPGVFPYTPMTGGLATGLGINLPAVGSKDHFMGARYGNPLFFQLETKRCSGTYVKAPWNLGWPKAYPPGSATGGRIRIGSYNIEAISTPTYTKVDDLADNIVRQNLDVIGLQETTAAHGTTLADLIAAIGRKGQGDWRGVGESEVFVLWRTSRWAQVSETDIGRPVDRSAATPIPTPAVRLTPAVADPSRQDIVVVSAHLEDRTRFFPSATIPERKADTHAAAASLLAALDRANPTHLPTLVAADLIGNFGSGYCDESSSPVCQPEGQPTFIRAGFLDAQAAVTKTGVAYSTLNKHVANQARDVSGAGGRADFIVVKGFTGVSAYAVVPKTYGDASAAYQSDHNIVAAELFIPAG